MDIVKMAREAEWANRRGTVMNWQARGHVTVLNDCDPDFITVQIEDEKFRCDRNAFPTTKLVAKLGLAIAAGRSDKNRKEVYGDHIADAMRYAMQRRYACATRKELWATYGSGFDETFPVDEDIYKQMGGDVVTAPVKRPSKQKGLRP